jgi:hypothetical protein
MTEHGDLNVVTKISYPRPLELLHSDWLILHAALTLLLVYRAAVGARAPGPSLPARALEARPENLCIPHQKLRQCELGRHLCKIRFDITV